PSPLYSLSLHDALPLCRRLGGEHLLRFVYLRTFQLFETCDLVERQFSEETKEAADIGIFGVSPILPVVIWREHLGIEPDGAGGGLAHFCSGRCGEQGACQAEQRRTVHAAAELDAVDDIAPLDRTSTRLNSS